MFKQVSLLRRFGCLLSTLPTYHYIIKYFKISTDKLLIILSCKAVNTNTKRKERNIEYRSQVTLSLVQNIKKDRKTTFYTFLHRSPINCISCWESIHSLLLQGKNEVSNQSGKHGMSAARNNMGTQNSLEPSIQPSIPRLTWHSAIPCLEK